MNTNKFQLLPDFYYTQEECNKHNRNKVQTNKRYSSFTQTHYTAGDQQQFDEYRDKNTDLQNLCKEDVDVTNNKCNSFIENINFYDKFINLDINSVDNTFKYIFNKFKKGLFIKIENNKLKVFLPFSKYNFTNEWSDLVQFEKNTNLIKFLKYVQESSGRKFRERNVNKFIDKWYSNNCLVRFEWPVTENDSGAVQMKNMFEELCKNRKLPDLEFFVNRRDFPLLTRNETEAYSMIFGPNRRLLSHNYKTYSPIFSMCSRDNYADICIPTWQDWERVSSISDGKFFPKGCRDYNNNFNINWSNKKNIAVFRGGSTGCGINIRNNIRLKVSYMSYTNPTYKGEKILDAGVTDFNIRPRLLPTRNGECLLTTIHTDTLKFGKVDFLSPLQQSEYKYIINIDGHSSAYRLSYELGMGSVILLVDSPYYIWCRKMLEPYVHYVPVKRDLSDLIEQIKWCIDHDDECKEIANNAKLFYDTYLTKDGVLDYLQCLLVRTKKKIGQYIYIKNPIEHQINEEINIIKKYTQSRTLGNDYKIPDVLYSQKYCVENAISQVIMNEIYNNDDFTSTYVNTKRHINSTKNVDIYNVNILDRKLAMKKLRLNLNDLQQENELIHHSFVGLHGINKICGMIPNFCRTYAVDMSQKYVLMENLTNGIDFGKWLSSKQFNMDDYIEIMLQIVLAIHVAQTHTGFIHYDLMPWNVILIYKPTKIKYQMKNCDFIEINVKYVPVIIDYGKSHIIYNQKHYGLFNMYQTSSIHDILSLLISSISIITDKQRLQKNQANNIVKLFSILSNTQYTNYKNYNRISDIKKFTSNAKKYSNLLFSNKGELENLDCISFFNHFSSFYKKKISNVNYHYNIFSYSNSQIIDYIYSNTNQERKKSYYDFCNRILNNVGSINTLNNSLNSQIIIHILKQANKINMENYKINFDDDYRDFQSIYHKCNQQIDSITTHNIKYFNFGPKRLLQKKSPITFNISDYSSIDKIMFNLQYNVNCKSLFHYRNVKDLIDYALCNRLIKEQYYRNNLKLLLESNSFYTMSRIADINTYVHISGYLIENIRHKLYKIPDCNKKTVFINKCNNILEKIQSIKL